MKISKLQQKVTYFVKNVPYLPYRSATVYITDNSNEITRSEVHRYLIDFFRGGGYYDCKYERKITPPLQYLATMHSVKNLKSILNKN